MPKQIRNILNIIKFHYNYFERKLDEMKKDNKDKDNRLYNRNFIQACNNAVNGIVYAATTQTNIRKQ